MSHHHLHRRFPRRRHHSDQFRKHSPTALDDLGSASEEQLGIHRASAPDVQVGYNERWREYWA
jgi:hypothetical protein